MRASGKPPRRAARTSSSRAGAPPTRIKRRPSGAERSPHASRGLVKHGGNQRDMGEGAFLQQWITIQPAVKGPRDTRPDPRSDRPGDKGKAPHMGRRKGASHRSARPKGRVVSFESRGAGPEVLIRRSERQLRRPGVPEVRSWATLVRIIEPIRGRATGRSSLSTSGERMDRLPQESRVKSSPPR